MSQLTFSSITDWWLALPLRSVHQEEGLHCRLQYYKGEQSGSPRGREDFNTPPHPTHLPLQQSRALPSTACWSWDSSSSFKHSPSMSHSSSRLSCSLSRGRSGGRSSFSFSPCWDPSDAVVKKSFNLPRS